MSQLLEPRARTLRNGDQHDGVISLLGPTSCSCAPSADVPLRRQVERQGDGALGAGSQISARIQHGQPHTVVRRCMQPPTDDASSAAQR